MTKELQPAIHKKYIREGKMTEAESEKIVENWEVENRIGGEENWSETHGAVLTKEGWEV